MPVNGIEAAKRRAKIDLHVAAHGPAQVLEPLDECCVSFLSIPFDSAAREHNNTPCPLALLRLRRQRPRRRRAAEQRDELAPSHVDPSRASDRKGSTFGRRLLRCRISIRPIVGSGSESVSLEVSNCFPSCPRKRT